MGFSCISSPQVETEYNNMNFFKIEHNVYGGNTHLLKKGEPKFKPYYLKTNLYSFSLIFSLFFTMKTLYL